MSAKKPPVIRASKKSWPFPPQSKVRLEFVYGLKASEGGRAPKTWALFQNLSVTNKEIDIIEMDWLSLPRLTPGRIFSKSPHATEGEIDTQSKRIKIPSSSQIQILTLQDAQAVLKSPTLAKAFNQDPLIAKTNIFHWADEEGFEYWIPAVEILRKTFVRSPELARAIIMYNGWDELVKDFTIKEDKIHIAFTKHPQINDIRLLSLIAANSNLLDCWNSIAINHLPRAISRVPIFLPWPFNGELFIFATFKTKSQHFWIEEILDIDGIPILFNEIIPEHPEFIKRTSEGDPSEKTSQIELENNDYINEESQSNIDPSILILDTPSSQVNRPRKLIHVQPTSLSELDSIVVNPIREIKSERPTILGEGIDIKTPGNLLDDETVTSLSDRISSSKPSADQNYGIGTKDKTHNWSGLENFQKALDHATTTLGDKANVFWPIQGTILQKPAQCGSRWFLKMENDQERTWCLAGIYYDDMCFYFIEVGREHSEESRFSLSMIFITGSDPVGEAAIWIEKMIKNNGHWDIKSINSQTKHIQFLPHKQKNDCELWGTYIAKKIKKLMKS